MKRKVIPLFMIGTLFMSSISVSAAWTTTTTQSQPNTSVGYSSVFSDIGGHWAQKYIEQWASNGIFGGMGNGTFSPNTNLTRAQFASVLNQLFDLQTVSEENIDDYSVPSDVPYSHWGRDAIALCLDNGVMNLRNGYFAPDQPITREEVFFSLGKAAKLDTLNVTGSNALNRFSDGYAVSSAARDIIGKMVSLGMISGRGNGILDPQTTITRAEVSTILTQAINYVDSTSVKNESFSNAVVFNVNKNKNLSLTSIKVNGNMFIKGSYIDTIELDNIDVTGTVYIYADSIESIQLIDVSNTDFVIICPDVALDNFDNSDDNNFVFENAMDVVFDGDADEITINGDYINSLDITGSTANSIYDLTINGENASEYSVKLSGVLQNVYLYGDVNISGYAKVKYLYLDNGIYSSTMVGDTTKVLSGKLQVAGNTYGKGTYERNEIAGAVTPNEGNESTKYNYSYTLSSSNTPKVYYTNGNYINSITVDGVTLSSANYSVNRSYAYIDFMYNYLNSLSVGTHTIKVYFSDGTNATYYLTIKTSANVGNYYTYTKGNSVPNLYLNSLQYSLTSVAIDNSTLNANEYSTYNGYLQLSYSRLNNLSLGEHKVYCYYSNGYVLTLTINVLSTSQSVIVTPATTYYTKGSVYNTKHSYVSFSSPNYIAVDGSAINSSYYTINTSNKTIELSSSYVNSLSVGTHTIRIYFVDGSYDTVSLVISDESLATSFIFDKTTTSSYYKNLSVLGITSAPTLIMVGDKVMSTNYYTYNSSTQEVILLKDYLSTLSTGEHTITISFGNTSRTIKVIVQQSSNNATFIYDKNTASPNNKNITLTGNISNSNLQVFVKNRQLNPTEFNYSSGTVTIFKSVFDSLEESSCYVGISSSAGTVSAVVNIVNTSSN